MLIQPFEVAAAFNALIELNQDHPETSFEALPPASQPPVERDNNTPMQDTKSGLEELENCGRGSQLYRRASDEPGESIPQNSILLIQNKNVLDDPANVDMAKDVSLFLPPYDNPICTWSNQRLPPNFVEVTKEKETGTLFNVH